MYDQYMIEDISVFNQLPDELIRHVFSYDDRFKHRNGMWMTQISKQDARYSVLRTINRRIRIEDKSSTLLFGNMFVVIYWGYPTNRHQIEYYYMIIDKENLYYIHTLQ